MQLAVRFTTPSLAIFPSITKDGKYYNDAILRAKYILPWNGPNTIALRVMDSRNKLCCIIYILKILGPGMLSLLNDKCSLKMLQMIAEENHFSRYRRA
ncbi:hypothetical protein CEXT_761161 [Caerostris extrusa]|uniref:Uncharacterized protein n=1 Tax=Caerostris extrusa TaxID=172846 RepID=A0AAV4R7H6_CAEEX|nr:hypothetical protein CEXT_761161 [Caerostris extrusa]